MSTIIKSSIVAFLLLLAVAMSFGKPRFIECTDTLECPVGSCCMIGSNHFSTPSCAPHLEAGEDCSPSAEQPINLNLTYPRNIEISLTNVHRNVCPCADGLFCSLISGKCEQNDITDNELENNFI